MPNLKMIASRLCSIGYDVSIGVLLYCLLDNWVCNDGVYDQFSVTKSSNEEKEQLELIRASNPILIIHNM